MAGTEYGKTENLYRRNDQTHKLDLGNFTSPHIRQIKDFIVTEKIDGTNMRIILDWGYDPEEPFEERRYIPHVSVRGRSDNANMPTNFLKEAFGVDEEWELSDRLFRALCVLLHGGESHEELVEKITSDPTMMVIYGEGYGAGIQKGGYYSPTKQFRAFDVVTYRYFDPSLTGETPLHVPEYSRPLWRWWDEVCDVCEVAKIKTVPVLAYDATVEDCVERIRDIRSAVAAQESGKEYARGSDLPHAEGIVARTDPYLYDWNKRRVFFKLKAHDMP